MKVRIFIVAKIKPLADVDPGEDARWRVVVFGIKYKKTIFVRLL